ncbi:hypothetical protein AB0C13_35160 [Streptomyces sp. NPDC049099]
MADESHELHELFVIASLAAQEGARLLRDTDKTVSGTGRPTRPATPG